MMYDHTETVLGEYIYLEDEEVHFQGLNPNHPNIKLCSKSLRIRANKAWTKLSIDDKQAMVAHEMGHRANKHYLQSGVMAQRLAAIVMGRVHENELQADKYAICLVGKEKLINCLRRTLQLSGNELSNMELRLRISCIEQGE